MSTSEDDLEKTRLIRPRSHEASEKPARRTVDLGLEETLAEPRPLRAEDKLDIGYTTLRFVPLWRPDFE